MTMLHRVFVYGTLKRGQPNHYWLTNDVNGLAEYVCEGVTNDSFPLVIGTRFNIPFLINLPKNGHCIVGEIYNVDDDMLNNLDKLEVYPTFYDRCKIDIYGTNGSVYNAWTYFLKSYPNDFLENRKFLNRYLSSEYPYIPPANRKMVAMDDLDYKNDN